MPVYNFAERLKEKITEEIGEEQKRLATGMAADWPDYKERCGLLKGLKRASDMIDDIDDKDTR